MSPLPLFPFGTQSAPIVPDPEKQGGKGAGLIAMSAAGVPVPPGFVIGTEVGRQIAEGQEIGAGLMEEVGAAIGGLEAETGRSFGGGKSPLLLSVRSGAAVSMPGMMDTVLNIGLNDETVEALARETGDTAFAWDTYRRLIQSYATIVLSLDGDDFELVLEDMRARENVSSDAELPEEALKELVSVLLEVVAEAADEPFPQDPHQQLERALLAVFRSWNTPRAKRFREMNKIPHTGGSAATVQAMVFGNRDEKSGTGVYFTRNPSTGEKKPYGEFMLNAQGEEVVSGIRTPQELTEEARARAMSEHASMENRLPGPFQDLLRIGGALERRFADVQEIEFTVEQERLYILQTRSAKRTPKALLRSTVEMVDEGLIDKAEALKRCGEAITAPMLVAKLNVPQGKRPFCKGLPASPGAAVGEIVFTSDDAVAARKAGRSVILVRPETDPKDVHGMDAATGILTSRGGMTSHAAVVARSMNKPCVTAAMGLKIDAGAGSCSCLGTTLQAGDVVSLDGATGFAFEGELDTLDAEPDGALARLLEWRKEAG